MKIIHQLTYICVAVVTVCSVQSCSSKEDYRTVGNPPTANFTATPIQGMNNRWLITDLTPGAFIHQWTLGDGSASFNGNQKDTAYYPERGSYLLKLRSFNQDGFGLDSIEIVVPENDPDRCVGMLANLTGCDFKTWVLDNTAPGALWVGSPEGQQWWASGAGEPGVRPCLFNDEYTFNINGTYSFDNKGDIWVDEEGGAVFPADMAPLVGCAPFSSIPAKYAAWGTNADHRFAISGNRLNITGLGAFVGLYKAGNTAIVSEPENSNSYEIEFISATKIILKKAYDWGTWKFTLIPKD
ncbi:PKD domain-containing protein [Gynurincola endophyticus]|uniref:PKD domain-containing protein n=1 Tax=Gynurincola endophyticus TaxID=2479004 RepID=UPI000F8E4AFD|nr:PKD domain-containing protein [Gynurincola endophyticus]